MSSIPSSILVIEPNRTVTTPYGYIDELYPNQTKMKRVNSTMKAIDYLKDNEPDLVMLSASFSYIEQVEVLEKVKDLSQTRLIPVLIVVDLTQPLNSVPGTEWGGKLAVISSNSNALEVRSAIERIINAV